MDSTEIEQAYSRYFHVITAKCSRMLRDPTEAQDLAQETFARLWAKRNALRDPETTLAWIYRTATRLAIDRMRRRRVAAAAALEDGLAPDAIAQLEARQHLGGILGRLSARELEVLVLSRLDGLTHAEIAALLRISDRTVRRVLKAADATLQHATRLS